MREKFVHWIKSINPASLLMILSITTAFLMELLNRGSLYDAGLFTFGCMGLFLYNAFLVLITLVPSLLLKRRYFYLLVVEGIWLLLGLADRVIRTFRSSPLSFPDITVLKDGMNIANKYINIWSITGGILVIGILAISLVCGYRRVPPLPNRQFNIRNLVLIGVLVLLVVLTTLSGLKTGHLSIKFTNITEAYEEYGFVYCFLTSVISQGISEPDEYSPEAVDEVISNIEADTSSSAQENKTNVKKNVKATKENPNIIYVQLESFFDVSYINGIKLSENPTPFFSYLKENFSSGFLTVPVVGAGTVNTEFEVQTGMNLEDFGIGEYPYKTVLLNKTCENIAYLLGDRGYATHVVHNNTASFYSRNQVFANLGYNDFTSIEVMPKAEKNSLGWAKDSMLTSQITKVLNSTKEKDFIYTISVQSHGKYSDAELEEGQSDIIDVYGIDDKEFTDSFKYYLSQIKEVDEFIESLVSALDSLDEPTVLVLFGDHLPSLDLSADELSNGSLYQTEYVVWDNIGLKKKNKDLYAYQLSASVMKKLSYEDGLLMKYHQQCAKKTNYLSGLKLLEYDMLYGDQESYQYEERIWEPTQLKYGVDVDKIISVRQLGNSVHIHGTGFNTYSQIYVNGEACDTTYNSETFVMAELNKDIQPGDEIVVSQVNSSGLVMTTSKTWIVE